MALPLPDATETEGRRHALVRTRTPEAPAARTYKVHWEGAGLRQCALGSCPQVAVWDRPWCQPHLREMEGRHG